MKTKNSQKIINYERVSWAKKIKLFLQMLKFSNFTFYFQRIFFIILKNIYAQDNSTFQNEITKN